MNKKNIFVGILIVLALAVSVIHAEIEWRMLTHVFRMSRAANISQVNVTENYHLVTKHDKAPIVIPLQSIQKGKAIKIPILMYHHVGSIPSSINPLRDPIRKDMTASPTEFEQQVQWASQQGFTSITLQNILDAGSGKFTLPKKPIVFTFDDGYQDVFDNAVPVLKKYNFTGSFGIITQWTGQVMGTNVYASWQTIAAAQSQGMEIVSHTQNHFDGSNPKFTGEMIFKNLSGSHTDLQEHLGIDSHVLIYPYGHYTSNYIIQAKKAGFTEGITVHEGDWVNYDNLMEIPRIRIHGQQNFERFKRLISE